MLTKKKFFFCETCSFSMTSCVALLRLFITASDKRQSKYFIGDMQLVSSV